MLLALKESHSSAEPYILEVKRYKDQELHELKDSFASLSDQPLNTEFDQGYFQAWRDYITHQQGKAKSKREGD
jgi:hypothetical protein